MSHEEDDEYSICFGLIRLGSRRSQHHHENSSVDDTLSALYKLARAKKAQLAGYKQHERDAQLEALAVGSTDRSVALFHVRVALNYRKIHEREQQKLEQVLRMVDTIEEARRNVGHTASLFGAAQTLEEIRVDPDTVRALMDSLAEQVHAVEQASEELRAPLSVADATVDAELDALFIAAEEKAAPAKAAPVGKAHKQPLLAAMAN